ncbi:ABC transporter ATP-binding protein [Gemella morbillorum]|jgi:putative ABC transporter, ATP-binding protein|uniref:ABC transporter ATP-binding protein n=1 Tax=Gemella morbillorum TaxID=29391 RepID=A0AAP9HCM0_9BACL|nr:ABC transporter ATP-binding protein [Gemella morbillorum]QGS09228.1 ABC transporter ATP-binding protein [Gemella morbillorum]
MTLEFREYKKKIKKNIFLELDFKVSTGEILTIISNNTLELDSLKDSFKRRTKFKGEITFDNIDINEEKLIFSEDFGFYNHLSLEKNLLSLSKILGLTVPKDDIIGGLDLLELDPNKKYQQLLENEKIKFHTLFSVLINQNILILDYSKDNLTKDDKKALRELILEHSNNANIIILDTILNQYNNIADNVLVISDGEKSYYGLLDDLLIIKKLAAISVSHQKDLDNILQDYQYTIYNDKEIVVREEVLEDVVYLLLKNNIEISQIRNLGERIKLYEGEGVL